jgi:hypothetical protein
LSSSIIIFSKFILPFSSIIIIPKMHLTFVTCGYHFQFFVGVIIHYIISISSYLFLWNWYLGYSFALFAKIFKIDIDLHNCIWAFPIGKQGFFFGFLGNF